VPLDLGAQLPHTRDAADLHEIPQVAAELERAGFDSLWASDHVVLPRRIESRYHFAADGAASFPGTTPFAETLMTLAAAAAATTRVRLGTDVLVLPQRNPVLTAKQVATLAALSQERFELGVGAGWVAEEFLALGESFADRGPRMVEWIEIMRRCWTGFPEELRGRFYTLPAETVCLPAPARPVPVLVGGHSGPALRRAGQVGDGWLGQQTCGEIDTAALAKDIAVIRSAAEAAGRDPLALRLTLRIVQSAGRAADVAATLGDIEAVGIHEVIVDPVLGTAAEDVALLRGSR